MYAWVMLLANQQISLRITSKALPCVKMSVLTVCVDVTVIFKWINIFTGRKTIHLIAMWYQNLKKKIKPSGTRESNSVTNLITALRCVWFWRMILICINPHPSQSRTLPAADAEAHGTFSNLNWISSQQALHLTSPTDAWYLHGTRGGSETSGQLMAPLPLVVSPKGSQRQLCLVCAFPCHDGTTTWEQNVLPIVRRQENVIYLADAARNNSSYYQGWLSVFRD